jgi:5-formyltetrahydrofolate cyclo-ligase
MTKPDQTKTQVRQQMKRLLTALSASDKELESAQIVGKITQFLQACPIIKTVATYAAMPSEVNLDALHTENPEVSFCYPRCGENGRMEFYQVSNVLDMQLSAQNIREPDESIHQLVCPQDIDLYLCPAYAYSENGKRLGKGGGFYDRYLLKKHANAITLGVVFSCQKLAPSQIPTEAHDLLIDRVL